MKLFKDMDNEECSRFLVGLLGKIRDEIEEADACCLLFVIDAPEPNEDGTATINRISHLSNLDDEDVNTVIAYLHRERNEDASEED